MANTNKKLLKRILAAMLSVTLMSGAAVMTPIADFVGTNIVANATTHSGSVDIDYLSSGDLIKKGTEIYGDDMIQFIDANNTEPYPFYVSTSWITDQDFTVSSVSYYGSEYQLYLRAAANYTVTWLDNDGTTSLGTSAVTAGNTPVYDGETTKTVNGKEYRLKGWKDNNGTYYANGSLPAVTGNVTYTAVYAVLVEVETEASEYFATNQKLETYTGTHFKIKCDNVGDGDGFMLYSRYDDDYGAEFARATIESLDGAVITKLALSKGALDIESVYASHGTRTTDGYTATFSDVNATTVTAYSNSPDEVYIKSVKVYYKIKEKVEGYTVTWKDGTETLGETDVPTGQSPVYDGETTKTVNGKEYVLKGWKDNNGTYYAKDSLPAVTGDVTYTAVYAVLVEVESETETFEPFDTNQELESYIGTHFKISIDSNYGGTSKGMVLNQYGKAVVQSKDGTKITKLVATIGYYSPDTLLASAGTRTINGNVVTFTDINDTNVTLYGSDLVQVKHVDVYYKAKEKVEGYTVTWKDGETTLGETDVPTGKSPVYDGTLPTKESADTNYKYVLYWSDGENTYSPDELPKVTSDVTYTAVFKKALNLTSDSRWYIGDTVDFGDLTYVRNGFYVDSPVLALSGAYTVDHVEYFYQDYGNSYYELTLKSCDSDNTVVLRIGTYNFMGWGDTDVAVVLYTGREGNGTKNNAYMLQVMGYTDVTWLDQKGNLLSKNKKAQISKNLTYDGPEFERTKESEDPDSYEYMFRWTNGYSSFYDSDTIQVILINGKASYQATFRKSYKHTVQVGDVYFVGDVINCGEGVYLDGYSRYNPHGSSLSEGKLRIVFGGNYSENKQTVFLNTVEGSDSGGSWDIPTDRKYSLIDVFGIRITGGDGTQENPFTSETVPYYTVTYQNEDGTSNFEQILVENGKTPEYNGETPVKDGCIFTGWKDGNDTFYANGTALPNITANTTYTAVYDALPIIHSDDVFVNSTESTPEVVVTDPITGDILTEGTDYTLTINDDTVTVTGIGSYAGEVTKPFITLSKDVSVDVTRKKTTTGARVTLVGEWFIPEGAEILESGVARVHVSDPEGITKEYIYEHGIKKSPGIQYRNVKMAFSINLNKTAAQKKICAVTYVKYKIGDKEFTSISDVRSA